MPKPHKTDQGTWTVRYRDPTGRNRRRTFKKRVDADQFVHAVEVQKLKGEWVDPKLGKTRFADWWTQWDSTRLDRRPSTRARDDAYARTHVLPTFGGKTLAGIHRVDVERFVHAMTANGYAAATVRKAYQLLSGALEAAVEHGMLPRNPARNVKLPKVEHHEKRFLDAAEVMALADAIHPRYRALVLAAAYTGLRAGELAGLTVQAVDLTEGRLRVTQTLSSARGRISFGPPKTNAARRTLSLPSFLVTELRDHLATFGWKGGLVFTSPEGEPLHWTNFRRRYWKPAVDASVGEPCRFHDLRHTHAALLIAAGEHPKVIQSRLGHASIKTTLDTYGHLFDGLDRDAADRLDSLFREAGVPIL